ncbi:protein-disulfide reductase DsbD domain-containing protein [Algibacter lectus]|uniref:Cytochrome c-type biogenesis protein DsbD protein-disulfide reductase n=1 Tax=Algibacter lectus TaxID=221126 RepID=A0A090VH57_9FLAO|nr:protein-disulfide reductase DsbD domain-containing protein [Algibacter lectus]MWW25641.1 cytochrome C biogenesis protein [Algibacter lectus]TDY61588.1 thiol:disulfide interchange protein DsbD [Algibacter lectus]GAL64100.1 cytochrome c-type biogenesis protein DsbD protein-disulfide reductase [Algibacter lectus]
MKTIFIIITVLTLNISQAQILEPVKWETLVNRVSDTEFDLISTATIDAGWHLYAQTVPEGGPIATSFSFVGNGKFLKKGNTKEDEGHVVDDPIFGMKIKYFDNKAIFKQRIKVKTKKSFTVEGVVNFMVCNDIRCLAPTEEDLLFTVD